MFETMASETNTTAEVLTAARSAKDAENAAAARVLAAAAAWADLHPAESIGDAAVLAGYGENAVTLAGPGRRWSRSSLSPSWPPHCGSRPARGVSWSGRP